MLKINVLIEIPVVALDQTYTYIVPKELEEKIKIGIRVKVDFNNRLLEGFVISMNNDLDNSDYEIKEIISLVDEFPILNDELFKLGRYLKETTLCTLISAYQSMLPKAYKANSKSDIKIAYNTYVRVKELDENLKLTKKQLEVYNFIKENKTLKKEVSKSVLSKLEYYNLVEYIKEEIYRHSIDCDTKELNKLIDEQIDAYNIIKNGFNTQGVYLLHGVTGSGKSEVYFNLINDVIKAGKNVIFLVPEISLTTQMINRFSQFFGSNIAILHSKLSDQERYDEYRKILKKEVQIVVGARSAVFAPFLNIGLIVIDEEHSHTYKQENNPHYNAIDVAIKRSHYHNCPIILGSATPRLETFARASKNVYKLVTLSKRINNNMPKVEIVDMKEEYKKGNRLFSNSLKKHLDNTLKNKKQAIILLNRRGYATSVTCKNCGSVDKCPNCDISLTYHKTKNNMRCHYCGYTHFMIEKCLQCGSQMINTIGIGTQKLEEEVKLLYPNANIVRMDLDTTSKKNNYKKIIDEFYIGKYDILIGTQMISKGLDFPNVVLVGIINADSTLNIPDFRNSELNYQLLSQTSGRAGRSSDLGNVVIQTFNPSHYSITYAATHDYNSFYNYEMNIRRKLKYPPFYFITLIKIKSKDFKLCFEEGKKIVAYLKSNLDYNTTILGPTTAGVLRINNIYNIQILIKYKLDDRLLPSLLILRNNYKKNQKVVLDIDINPVRI